MDSFPAVDPIPLPAPVWLFKLLHTATLTLHFGAVYLLIGGAVFAAWWALRGRRLREAKKLNAAGALAHRLPVVMAFVINLGIPPLLFAQVLYGRALYTSSVLMGAWWLGVIPCVIAAYYLMYRMAARAETGRPFGWGGVLVIVLVLGVAYLYSTNMTLMLRPGAWQALYRSGPAGSTLPAGDPTTLPRWLFMMLGGVGMGGIGLYWLGMQRNLDAEGAALLRRTGARALTVFTLAQIVAGFDVLREQPEAVRAALGGSALYTAAGLGWLLLSLALAVIGLTAAAQCGRRTFLWPSLMAMLAFFDLLCIVAYRDGIRDITLRLAGFEVWDRTVAANWPVIGVFLLLFAAAGGFLAWMGYVVYTAKGGHEQYA